MPATIAGDRRQLAARGSTLDRLLRDIRRCRICRDRPLHRPRLPHEPHPVLRAHRSARILIASQAPGARVHRSGTPFTDPSGVRLRHWLGTTEEEFYDTTRVAIVPMGFCFPGQHEGSDLPPRRECAATWHDGLMLQLPRVALVLAIGSYAQRYHFRRLGLAAMQKASLTETIRDWRAIWGAREAPRLLPLPHPSWRNTGWLARNPWFETELVPVLRREVRRLLESRDG